MKFLMLAALLNCQGSFLVSQKAPKCSDLGQSQFVPISEITSMESYNLIYCKDSEWKPYQGDYNYFKCGKIQLGCSLSLKDGKTIRTLEYCGKWKKLEL